MASKPVDVMVVNFNTAGLLQPMFDALRRADSERLASYLVVDNASRDDSVQRMAQVCPEALLLSNNCLLYTSPSPRDKRQSRMPSSA